MYEWRWQHYRFSHPFRAENQRANVIRGVQPAAFPAATQQCSLRERLDD
ncbi:MAG: hypothetical protein AB7H80_09670 [Candidatus Kapaibacterium sp.]